MSGHRGAADSPRGQVLVIFAAGIVVLLAFAGLAIEVGRALSERRHIQNAADAGALAGCEALIDGASDADAAAAARDVATLNLPGSPAGATATIASDGSREYEPGNLGNPAYLTSGIIVDGIRVRVAVASTLPATLARLVGIQSLDVGARARCSLEGGPTLPIIARRYQNAPGPGGGFVDHAATAATSTNGQEDQANVLGYGGRTPASEAEPGPVFSLYGPDSKAGNDSSFRGFIAIDIRNFADANSRRYYNGVSPDTNANTIKEKEGAYITARFYPGPAFPPVTTPPDPNSQVAVINGNDTAMVVGNFGDVYRVGDRVILGLYSGTVKSIPDFSITPPARVDLPATTSTPVDGPGFTVARNDDFAGTVELHLHGDENAPSPDDDIVDAAAGTGTPASGKMNQPTWDPAAGPGDGFRPSRRGTTVTMRALQTNAVPPGIYTAWLEGHSSSPYLTVRRQSVPVRIGGAVRDFSLDNSVTIGQTDTLGATIDLDLYVSTAKTSDATNWGSAGTAVALSVDAATLPPGMTVPPSFSASTVTPAVASGNNLGTRSVLSINTSGLAAGTYTFIVRAKGTNGDGQPVTHLLPIQFSVASQPSTGSYVDVIGFAVFKVSGIDANAIQAQVVSQVYADPNDPALRRAMRARLIPWRDAP